MSRYRALRLLRCDPLSAGLIAFFNWLRDVPPGEIRVFTAVLEYDHEAAP